MNSFSAQVHESRPNELSSSSAQPFSIELHLHHPHLDPAEFTETFSLQPWFARRKGEKTGGIQHKQTVWLCRIHKGIGNVEFLDTLHTVVDLVSAHRPFFKQLTSEGGVAELVINADVTLDEGIIYDLSLDPKFLQELALSEVGLRSRVWSRSDSWKTE